MQASRQGQSISQWCHEMQSSKERACRPVRLLFFSRVHGSQRICERDGCWLNEGMEDCKKSKPRSQRPSEDSKEVVIAMERRRSARASKDYSKRDKQETENCLQAKQIRFCSEAVKTMEFRLRSQLERPHVVPTRCCLTLFRSFGLKI